MARVTMTPTTRFALRFLRVYILFLMVLIVIRFIRAIG
jgi:hypothetical protein